jgi:hypothetical protein
MLQLALPAAVARNPASTAGMETHGCQLSTRAVLVSAGHILVGSKGRHLMKEIVPRRLKT